MDFTTHIFLNSDLTTLSDVQCDFSELYKNFEKCCAGLMDITTKESTGIVTYQYIYLLSIVNKLNECTTGPKVKLDVEFVVASQGKIHQQILRLYQLGQ